MFVHPRSRPFRSFMVSHKSEAAKVQARLESLVPLAQDYFRLENPTLEVTEPFARRVGETLGLLIHVVSRAVLATERTKKRRYRRLAVFGFWIDVPPCRPSPDLVVTVIGAALYFRLLFMLIPRPEPRPFAQILSGALPISVEVGIAVALGVQAAIWSERQDPAAGFPPLALWLGVARVATAMCGAIRLLIFAMPYIGEGALVALVRGWQGLMLERRWAWRVISAA